MSRNLPPFLTDFSVPIPDPFGLGQDAVNFISGLILSNGKPFDLHPVHERILRKIFGDVHEDGQRKVGTLYLHVPRGQAKSTFIAAIVLMLLSHPKFRIKNGQLVVAAPTKELAGRLTFTMVKGFIEREFTKPEWADFPNEAENHFKIVDNQVERSIEHIKSGSTLRVVPQNAGSVQGLECFCIVGEETHEWSSGETWAALTTSIPKVEAANPLVLIATTAGEGVGGIGHDLYSEAKDYATGKHQNPNWLPVIYEADPDDQWDDERVWHKTNFALGKFKSLPALRSEALECQRSLTKRRKFERYHLNIWHEGASDPWLELSVYDEGKSPFNIDDIKHLPATIGIDVSSTRDITAVVVTLFDAETRNIYVVPYFWLPTDSVAKRTEEDSVPYLEWVEAGYITPTDGGSIDESAVEDKIRELCAEFTDIRHIGFDPWNARRLASRLMDDGLPAVEVPQQYKTLSPAMKLTERLIIDGRLRHGGHPVLRWMFLNVPMPKPDPSGNIRPSKTKSRSLKIDGAVATMIALFLLEIAEEEPVRDYEYLTGRKEATP